MKQRSLLAEFDVVASDPPWMPDDKNTNGDRGAIVKYQCMPTVDICSMQLPFIASDAWLFLWRLASMQPDALRVVEAWGFTIKSELIWRKLTKTGKPWFGLGHYTRATHETVLVCTRGKVKPHSRSVRSMFEAPVPVDDDGKYIHSAKPNRFYEIAEQLTGPGLARVEMFGRRQRKGWNVLGLEAHKFKEVA